MKKRLIIFCICFWCIKADAQTVTEKLKTAYSQFENDPQLNSALASLYVVDGKTDAVIFDKSSTIGLAPASTQKLFTSTASFELLRKNFTYKTTIGYRGKMEDGNILITGSGDPTLGSWRWEQTKEQQVIKGIVAAIKKLPITVISHIDIDNRNWNYGTVPDGWLWQDIGSYYGAGAAKFNWRENQFDIALKSGSIIGDTVRILNTDPETDITFTSQLTAAAKGSGDNAYVYYPLHATEGILRGTIPVNENHFTISATMPQPEVFFIAAMKHALQENHIAFSQSLSYNHLMENQPGKTFYTITSPPLDSIIYWFLKRSINLYGEALLKTIGYQQNGVGATDTGVAVLKDFWKTKGISASEINIVDGSGLSPLNRVTTHAQVMVLQYAQKQPWFESFYHALPEYNDMKMKSGTIHDVKGFAGYHTSKSGKSYIFSFLVNNYNGPSSTLVQKMYKVLDVLK